MRRIFCIVVFCFLGAACWADTVRLYDGQVFHGKILSQDKDSVTLRTREGNVETFDRRHVKNIEEGDFGSPYRHHRRRWYRDDGAARSREVLLKLGFDFSGRHTTSDSTLFVEGSGNSSADGTVSVDPGLTVAGEFIGYPATNVGLGGGMAFQSARALADTSAYFSFVPVYGTLKLRTTPVGGNYAFLAGQLGYNFFTGNGDYRGANGRLDGGLYWGAGAGVTLHRFQVELLYSEDNGKASSSGYLYNSTTRAYDYFEESGNIRYSHLGLNVGYIF